MALNNLVSSIKGHYRHSTSYVDPKTNEPDDDFSNNTFYLEEVIGDVVYDVKESLGSSKLVSGMGFGGKFKSLVKGAFMQFSDATGGHVQPEVKL